MAKRPSFLNIRPVYEIPDDEVEVIEIPDDEDEMMADEEEEMIHQSPEIEPDGLALGHNNAVAPILVANAMGPLEFPPIPEMDPNFNPELPAAQLVPILQAQINELRERQISNQQQHNQTVKEMQNEIKTYKTAFEKCEAKVADLESEIESLKAKCTCNNKTE